jgi:penicillin V acylase-like amidase (Ntn superfamily)
MGRVKSPSKLVTSRATMFGHSWKFPLHWGLGDPEERNLILSIEENEFLIYDNGYGSS